MKTGTIKYADQKGGGAPEKVAAEKVVREEKKLAASAAPPPVRKRKDEPRKRKGQHDQILEDWSEFAGRRTAAQKKSRRRRLTRTTPTCCGFGCLGRRKGGRPRRQRRTSPSRTFGARRRLPRSKIEEGYAKLRGKKKRRVVVCTVGRRSLWRTVRTDARFAC